MVIARRVRGRFSITRLLSRSVRFYFVLSRSLPLPRRSQPAPFRLILSYSLLIHLSRQFSRRRSRRAYFGPSMPLSLPVRPSLSPSYLSCPRSLVSVSRVTVLRSYLPPSRPSFRLFPPHSPRRSRTSGRSILLFFTLPRAPSPSPIISGLSRLPVFLPLFSFSFHFSRFLSTSSSPDRSVFSPPLELFSLYLLPFSRVIGDKAGGSGPSSI